MRRQAAVSPTLRLTPGKATKDGYRPWYAMRSDPAGRRIILSTNHVDRRLAEVWLRNMFLTGDPGVPGAWYKAAARMVASSRKNAHKRGRAHTVSIHATLTVLQSQAYRCAVSGVALEPLTAPRGASHPWAPSLDQIRPGEGYTPANVRVVCNAANYAMHNWGEDALRRLAFSVVQM